MLDIKDTIYPIKGQMIVIKAKVGVVEHIILDQGRYIPQTQHPPNSRIPVLQYQIT